MNDPSFSRVSQSSQALYGPRKLLICGFTPEGQNMIDEVIAASAIADLPLVFAGSTDLESPLSDILPRANDTGRGEVSRMPAAVIMAGITEKELHQLIARYRQTGLPDPLWATLTPTSEHWTLRQLLKELSAERAALSKQSSPARPTD